MRLLIVVVVVVVIVVADCCCVCAGVCEGTGDECRECEERLQCGSGEQAASTMQAHDACKQGKCNANTIGVCVYAGGDARQGRRATTGMHGAAR
jgi:hypothetical protein